jgi:cytochrome P450
VRPPTLETGARAAGRVAPGPPRRRVVRSLLTRDLLDLLFSTVVEHGEIVRWRAGRRWFFLLTRPEHIEHVLGARQDRYVKSFQYRLLAVGMGEGLLTNEGESWARQRRLIQPMFARRHLGALAPHITAAAADLVARWERHADGTVLDVAAEMSALALDAVGRALFGAALAGDAERVGPAVLVGLRTGVAAARLQLAFAPPRALVDRGRAIFRLPLLPPRLARFRDAMATVDEVVGRLVAAREASEASVARAPAEGEPTELLGLLLAARDEAGRPMSRRQVRDELVTFLLAGHETTANGLAWMWYLLSLHPEARERMLAEVDARLGDRLPDADDADALPWTTACFAEAIRLYPPAWVFEREAVADDLVDGYEIPAGSTVIISPFLVHRDPTLWPNPEGFDPRRFLPERARDLPRMAYLPFGAGRRACVGAGFARMEAALVAAVISQRFTLDLAPGARVRPEPTITLRPRGGLPMMLRRRG